MGGLPRLEGTALKDDIQHVLEVDSVTKRFGSVLAVDDVSFRVARGSFVTLLGPSGCGKTTTLRLIAGFEQPDEGRIVLNGEDIRHRPPFARNVNTVFQNYALFPHMTVFENIAFGLESRKRSRDEVSHEVNAALSLINLPGHGSRYPDQLSGGERQRVAVARAFVNKPDLLLLDEPLGALDLKLRLHMQVELKRLQQELGIAFVYVTHDQEEALTMSDRVIVMNHSVIEQTGVPVDLYRNPRTAFVADFLGGANLLPLSRFERCRDGLLVEFCGLRVLLPQRAEFPVNREGVVSIRPEKLALAAQAEACPHRLSGTITDIGFKGTYFEVQVRLDDGSDMVAKCMAGIEDLQMGQRAAIGFRADDVVLVSTSETHRR